MWYGCTAQYQFDSVVNSSRQALGDLSPLSNVRLNPIVPPGKYDIG